MPSNNNKLQIFINIRAVIPIRLWRNFDAQPAKAGCKSMGKPIGVEASPGRRGALAFAKQKNIGCVFVSFDLPSRHPLVLLALVVSLNQVERCVSLYRPIDGPLPSRRFFLNIFVMNMKQLLERSSTALVRTPSADERVTGCGRRKI